ncbi:MAG TPA: hypothetical protein VN923_10465 [Thermoanaerobaculia bacterium]|nr:hypothetical protein [Thermoanaerobaculia bacterium]
MRIAARAGHHALVLALLLIAGAAAAAAQVSQGPVPRVLIGDVQCIPRGGHGVAQAVAGPLTSSTDEVRVYFRRTGYGDFYWVPARPTSDGRYWAVLPVPEPDNHQAELYAAVVGPNNTPRAQSRVITVPVEPNCHVQLGNAQEADSQHLTVGETSLGQKFRKVAWWQCDGIRERVDVHGDRRDDDSCVAIAWWERPELMAPLFLAGAGGITTIQRPKPVSPAAP